MKKKFLGSFIIFILCVIVFWANTFSQAIKNTEIAGFLQGFSGCLGFGALIGTFVYGYKGYFESSTVV
ncbi:MAG: hypothetical protein JWR05_455 [Mucilaginibacter sp.]|nr:hypothetical protein [Mucilaginibacter sp.]